MEIMVIRYMHSMVKREVEREGLSANLAYGETIFHSKIHYILN